MNPAGEYVAIASNSATSAFCALRRDGSAECWGLIRGATPQGVFTEIAVGGFAVFPSGSMQSAYACAIRQGDGHPVCWGSMYGESVEPPAIPMHSVSIGYDFACGIRNSDQTAVCWGPNAPPPPKGSVASVAASYDYACSIDSRHRQIECWGHGASFVPVPPGPFASLIQRNAHLGVCALDAQGHLACFGREDFDLPEFVVPKQRFWSVEVSAQHGCGIVRGSGELLCFGDDASRWREHPALGYNRAITPPAGLEASAVALSFDHSCVIRREDGGITCFGSMAAFEGRRDSSERFAELLPYDFSMCARTLAGELACWREATFSDGSPKTFGAAATMPPEHVRFEKISMADLHACGMVADTHEILCWGRDPNAIDLLAAPEIPGRRYRDVAVSNSQSCGILEADNTIECWSTYDEGPPPGEYVSIAAGRVQMCAMASDGTLVCWGANDDGESDPPPGPFSSMALAWDYGCGLRGDGHAECWGDTRLGGAHVPTDLAFDEISVHGGLGCGIVEGTGQVACWGSRTRVAADVPPNLPRAKTIGVTFDTACILTEADDREICWGAYQRNL